MRLYQWRGHALNFGDELNTILWPDLLPGFFNEDDAEIFLGIGSVLDDRHPRQAVKIVAGAGYGGYEAQATMDADWIVHWVRGPETAARLGLPVDRGLGDPASLIDAAFVANAIGAGGRTDAGFTTGRRDLIGFMPHFETARRGLWGRAAELAGVALIDPRDEVRSVLARIACCRLLICEAMHGAIVADALRVPWIAIEPFAPIHAPKWADWGSAIGLSIAFRRLAPSSFNEHLRQKRLADRRGLRSLLDGAEWRLQRIGAERYVERSAEALQRAAWAVPQLSTDQALDRCRDAMRGAIDRLRRNPRRIPPLIGRAAA
jgi:succinoglycan biosynthesis protein ExoV